MVVDEDGAESAKETCNALVKIFADAEDKRVASVAKFIASNIPKLDLLGKEMAIAGKTVSGKEFDLKNLKGKVVLVDFWATWCAPCIAELPNMENAYKKYQAQGFDIVGISLDRPGDDEKLAKFIEARKMPWPSINIADSRPLAVTYKVNSIPFPVLVDREGRVVSFRARGPHLERLLERLLAEKK
jgi:thiol-disulfide isomerase/thioredoxin